MKPENCAVFILAAGLSTRFGLPDKLIETLGGEPILSHAIETAKAVEFQSSYGIVPHTSQRRRALFEKNKFEVIENATPETGQGSSIILAAHQAIEDNYEGVCIILGDMPFIASDHLRRLVDALYDKEAAISHCNQTIMPPMAVRKSMFVSLANINPSLGAKSLFKQENIAHIPLSNQAAQDIDKPETLAWLNAQLGV